MGNLILSFDESKIFLESIDLEKIQTKIIKVVQQIVHQHSCSVEEKSIV
jgi:hypothetical protein